MKKAISFVFVIFLLSILAGCSGVTKADYQKIFDENMKLASSLSEAQAKLDEFADLEKKYDVLKEDHQKSISETNKLKNDLTEAQARIDEFFELENKYKNLSDSEIAAQQAANELKAEKDRQAKEKLLAEEKKKAEAAAAAAAAAAEAEAKKGYDTGITYNQLARTPDDYVGKKVKFTGKVIQVIEGSSEVNLRVAVNKNYDTVLLVFYPKTLTKTRVLENDIVTLYGVSQGLHTYKSTMGGDITIPLVKVDKIDIK